MKSERLRQNLRFKIPPHITGIRHLRCVCGATLNDEHVRLPQWLKIHRDCKALEQPDRRKLCVDCRYAVLKQSAMIMHGSYYQCDRPTFNINWVDGSKEMLFCGTERTEGACGPAAKFFEKKPAERKPKPAPDPGSTYPFATFEPK